MDAKKGVVVVDDALAWMLVEATGDSEVDAKIKPVDGDDDDHDDAESCISDVPEENRRGDKKNQKVAAGQEEKIGGVDEQKGKPIISKNKSSTASVDSTEDEKNRLFWEACLGS
ncbi:uncharacterized protein LOC119982662 [Tripterygium wilfordii]|uniref:uncharacterized protein LOC119982662 n=1 Tax=Tripterygium wilfordii TaxID=458696 RepID=UPI0018F85EC4|nr:uncharacterized protein LOC119982662 [Tripterygium wilfordii]